MEDPSVKTKRPTSEPDSIDEQLGLGTRAADARPRDRGDRRTDPAARAASRPLGSRDARAVRPEPRRMASDGASALLRPAVPRQAREAREAPGAVERCDDEPPRQHGAAGPG